MSDLALPNTGTGIFAVNITKGMAQGSLFEEESIAASNVIWENSASKEAARRYDAALEEHED